MLDPQKLSDLDFLLDTMFELLEKNKYEFESREHFIETVEMYAEMAYMIMEGDKEYGEWFLNQIEKRLTEL